MSIKPKNEQRRTKRISANVPVSVKKLDDGAQELTGQTRDVSMSMRGVFMYLSNRVAEGSELELVFPMPRGVSPAEDTWVRCKARVLRVEKEENGNRFGVAAVIETYENLADSVAHPA
ncbi:MAG TPA: PilZ domain-containing protein [Terriglobales bacterium]|nr:PilZ domain-containing protein [Terriglobales bacterium]